MLYSRTKKDVPMDAKSLLDSLMGASRNQDTAEQKKNKGNNFKKKDICKHFLLGFCPGHEVGQTKLSRFKGVNEEQCRLTHSEAMKEEFEKHEDHKELRKEYEESLLRDLRKLVREAGVMAKKEQGNVKKNEVDIPGSTQFKKLPQHITDEVERLTKDMNKLMAAAEDIAEKGDVDGSKFKVMLADEINSKIAELKADYARPITKYREEEVCDVCGQRLEAFDPKNTQRYDAHFTGIVHVLFMKIQKWYKELDDKHGGGSSRDKKDRSPSKEAAGDKGDKEQGGDASKEEKGGDSAKDRPRDGDRDRRRSRSARDRGDRDRDRGGDRGDRDRDRDRGGDRDRNGDRDRRGRDRRDRSRSRRR